MKNILIISILLFQSIFVAFSQMHPYYYSIDFSQPAATVQFNLKNLITFTHSPLSYSDTYPWIKLADEDPINTSNVILIYNSVSESKNNTFGGGNTTNPEVWNREHVYPNSLINVTAEADLHHLRACDGTVNNNRGNKAFADGSGSFFSVSSTLWFPGDEWKGDVARMIMYMNLRYNLSFEDMGTLNLFLQWNIEDPVSDFERQRNNIIYGAQGNRNPFIDQPYLATYFWGGADAEDLWGWPNTVLESKWKNAFVYPNPVCGNQISIENFDVNFTNERIYITDILGNVVQVYPQNALQNNVLPILENLANGTYFLNIANEQSYFSKRILVLR